MDLTQKLPVTMFPQEQRLLPGNRTHLESDLVKVQQRISDIYPPIREILDPWKCPAKFLPWLAASWGVDLWYEDWPEVTKRRIIANIVDLKRGKGTPHGIANYLNYVPAQVVKMVRPPAKGIYRGAMTDADRLKWLADLPQVRIYPYTLTRKKPKKRAFYDGPNRTFFDSFYGDRSGRADAYMQTSLGPIHYGKQAFVIDPLGSNVEVPARYENFQDPNNPLLEERVYFTTVTKRKFYKQSTVFYRTTLKKRAHWQTSPATSNMLAVRVNDNALQQFAAFSGDIATDVRPERVNIQRIKPKGRGFFRFGLKWHAFWRKGFTARGAYQTSWAPHLIYDRIAIYTPTRLATKRKVRTFHGHARYGIAPYTAELTIQIDMRRPKTRMGTFMDRLRFMKKADLAGLYRTLDAVHISKSYRDKILVQPQIHSKLRLASHLHLTKGTKLGQDLTVGRF